MNLVSYFDNPYIQKLPRLQELMDMHYLWRAGMSREEVGLAYGLSKSTINQRMSQLRGWCRNWFGAFVVPFSNVVREHDEGPLFWPAWKRKLWELSA
ncbi:hypothetical protein LCGC14_1046120 [marine sediment metagenome]|uniref:Uncharacterized protein n=1 Tax=marine sediment metagenome TaxID=412755 RepID=A0A0F9MQB8_9ZZZZ